MRKLGAVLALTTALIAAPQIASAAPISPSSCAFNSDGVQECDLFADYANGLSELTPTFGDYLPAYTLLLAATANLSDGLQESEVAHILVVHDQLFELFSNIATSFVFDAAFAAASTNSNIDGGPPTQILGCPDGGGVLQVNGVGYCGTADVVTLFPNWGDAFFGGADLLRIHTAQSGTNPPNPVPEPGTFALFALGGTVAAAIRRRRDRRL